MLNKEVCKRCKEKVTGHWWPIEDVNWSEGKLRCPGKCREDWLVTGVEALSWYLEAGIPADCVYATEHVVSEKAEC